MEPYLQLEKEFGEWAGYQKEQVVACSSGTAALHLALEALELGSGSKIIIPDYTMIACARAATLTGMVPIFVDCGYGLLLSWEALERGLDLNCSAIMPVHIYGRQCDMDWIIGKAQACGWAVIEDMAEAHGLAPHRDTNAACWSFYKNKIICGEEGGIVVFKKRSNADLARQLRSLGFDDRHNFMHAPRGHNYRLANCLAEKILKSLGQVEANLWARQKIEAVYDLYCPSECRMPPRQVPWVYDLRIRGMNCDQQVELVRSLNEQGIQARHGFKPMSWQLEYSNCELLRNLHEHTAERLASEIIYLPIVPGRTTEEEVERSFSLLCTPTG